MGRRPDDRSMFAVQFNGKAEESHELPANGALTPDEPLDAEPPSPPGHRGP